MLVVGDNLHKKPVPSGSDTNLSFQNSVLKESLCSDQEGGRQERASKNSREKFTPEKEGRPAAIPSVVFVCL